MSASDLVFFEKAEALLAAIVAEYAARGESPPDRQFVTTGPPALDDCDGGCETLAVSIGRIYLGQPTAESDGRVSGGALDAGVTVEITTTVARRIPVVDDSGTRSIPTPEDLADAARITATDAHVLVDGIRAQIVAGDLFSTCTEVVIGPVVPLDNEGGLGGWAHAIAVQL